jgi:hypothetical protein
MPPEAQAVPHAALVDRKMAIVSQCIVHLCKLLILPLMSQRTITKFLGTAVQQLHVAAGPGVPAGWVMWGLSCDPESCVLQKERGIDNAMIGNEIMHVSSDLREQ